MIYDWVIIVKSQNDADFKILHWFFSSRTLNRQTELMMLATFHRSCNINRKMFLKLSFLRAVGWMRSARCSCYSHRWLLKWAMQLRSSTDFASLFSTLFCLRLFRSVHLSRCLLKFQRGMRNSYSTRSPTHKSSTLFSMRHCRRQTRLHFVHLPKIMCLSCFALA